MTKIFYRGNCVAVFRTNNRKGTISYGYVGQQVKDKLLVFVPDMGICVVEKRNAIEEMDVISIEHTMEEIEKEILKQFPNNKKLAICFEVKRGNGSVIQCWEIPVNKSTVHHIANNLSMNTVPHRYGLCIRDTKDKLVTIASYGKLMAEFDSEQLESLKRQYVDHEGLNNGNFMEFLLSGNKEDLEKPFRDKHNENILRHS